MENKAIDVDGAEEIHQNEGNFRTLLRMRLESGDEDLKDHLMSAKKNATYLSWASQNDIIDACNEVIFKKLVEKINASKCFTILADETTDASCVEQLSLCIRYVDTEKVEVHEDFIQFVPLTDMSGKGISEAIMLKLKSIGVKFNKNQLVLRVKYSGKTISQVQIMLFDQLLVSPTGTVTGLRTGLSIT